ncbi:hypothetical protein [Nocardiopsis dassonvillei]|uniref:hypothetical protein n=1 Tax=Nocardiopsis dassonvillei TaxID=2014 RepID=UPI0033EE3B56
MDQNLHHPWLCATIVDRLTFGGTIIETATDSYRLAQTQARDVQAAAAHRSDSSGAKGEAMVSPFTYAPHQVEPLLNLTGISEKTGLAALLEPANKRSCF